MLYPITVCPRSPVHFYKTRCHIKRNKASWTYSIPGVSNVLSSKNWRDILGTKLTVSLFFLNPKLYVYSDLVAKLSDNILGLRIRIRLDPLRVSEPGSGSVLEI